MNEHRTESWWRKALPPVLTVGGLLVAGFIVCAFIIYQLFVLRNHFPEQEAPEA